MGLDCAPTVQESNVFRALGIALSEKQIPDHWKCWILGTVGAHPHWLRDTTVVYGLFRNSLRLACGYADFPGNLLRRDSCFRAPRGYHPAGNRE